MPGMKRNTWFWAALAQACCLVGFPVWPGLAAGTPAGRSELYSCDFKQPLGREWRFISGNWI
jgi:hypothetical protein